MSKSVIAEGKTTNEAIENGLKQLNVERKNVEIETISEENKKSFFSILAPRNVKIKLTIKENELKEVKREESKSSILESDFNLIKKNIDNFLKEFFDKLEIKNIKYDIKNNKSDVRVNINGDNINSLIGYRGETLIAFQTLISRIGNKNVDNKSRIIVDIEGYREKRIKALQDLAVKVSKTVLKNKKSITLEPMSAFERKIIHDKLQENSKVITHSIGREPNRRVVIEIKNK